MEKIYEFQGDSECSSNDSDTQSSSSWELVSSGSTNEKNSTGGERNFEDDNTEKYYTDQDNFDVEGSGNIPSPSSDLQSVSSWELVSSNDNNSLRSVSQLSRTLTDFEISSDDQSTNSCSRLSQNLTDFEIISDDQSTNSSSRLSQNLTDFEISTDDQSTYSSNRLSRNLNELGEKISTDSEKSTKSLSISARTADSRDLCNASEPRCSKRPDANTPLHSVSALSRKYTKNTCIRNLRHEIISRYWRT
ncbi:hypothetical protein NPIL_143581 [Nephila pilipes]|uniref:Uncharacterized protein n=1 Tax=Nephila pilipes TaxID=299642 RepID=A0A8X6PV10_NEPPI|nr:hypothetical protein NPIL_143581 [Nephila pilipes]